MRLHAGSHVDAPEHMVKGGKQLQELALETFAGDGVVADVRHRVPGGGITADDLAAAVGAVLERGDRLLLRTDLNQDYFASDWAKRAPYLTRDAVQWCIDKGVVLVGFDFYHGQDAPDSNVVFYTSRTFGENGVVTMPYLNNLDRITQPRFTLLALPLKMIGVEASPVRAVVLEE
jgi:arylformamidase